MPYSACLRNVVFAMSCVAKRNWKKIVQATPAENLWILPAGRCDVVSYQALSGQSIPVIMQRLTTQFDFTVVDSGCVLTGPESMIFGQHVGGGRLVHTSRRKPHAQG